MSQTCEKYSLYPPFYTSLPAECLWHTPCSLITSFEFQSNPLPQSVRLPKKALKMAKIFVLGGDGFCGWPTSLHLSSQGHDVTIIDNLSRRAIDLELEAGSLTPIQPMGTRLKAWKEVSGNTINFHNCLLYTSPSPRDATLSRMPSSA